ncbi:hypothetical protein F7725_021213 [Dissostichus mawsoni]|uniref:Uncharacterized protein n=1 Tax=Dissostichus mawsoni TaxID=36200 RepID=A0A7J5YFI3_DISMA|nr:hypothetical protein F7725_021213 [Dissostichus mawsoni]
MNSPLRYFQINLKLRAQFDIHKLLEDAHISPSCDRPYKLSEVQQALVPRLGEKLQIQCVTDEKPEETSCVLSLCHGVKPGQRQNETFDDRLLDLFTNN